MTEKVVRYRSLSEEESCRAARAMQDIIPWIYGLPLPETGEEFSNGLLASFRLRRELTPDAEPVDAELRFVLKAVGQFLLPRADFEAQAAGMVFRTAEISRYSDEVRRLSEAVKTAGRAHFFSGEDAYELSRLVAANVFTKGIQTALAESFCIALSRFMQTGEALDKAVEAFADRFIEETRSMNG